MSNPSPSASHPLSGEDAFRFPPLVIGPFRFPFPVIEAALSGYSDAPMRRLAKSFGCPFALCEVFLDQFVMDVSKKRKARLYLAVRDADHPCGAQVMGSQASEIVPAALRLVEFGFDLIDLNFACPVRKVLARGRGGALMADVPRALAIVEEVRRALPDSIPLTVKLRKGFDGSEKSREKFFALVDGLLDLGITGITLHGRTVEERYQGTADWDFVREVVRYIHEVKSRPDFPVIGSGDLFTAKIAEKRLTESGVNGLAIARGAIGNPWIFRDLRAVLSGAPLPAPPTIQEQRQVLADHWGMAEELYGPRRASTEMRKFLLRYAEFHPLRDEVRKEFVLFKNREALEKILEKYYGS